MSAQAGGDDEEDEKAERNNAAEARRERQLQINRQAQHRHREKRKAREVEFEGRIKQLTEQLAQMSCLKDENDFLKGHLQLEQRQVCSLVGGVWLCVCEREREGVCVCVWVVGMCVCVCVRDVKEEHTLLHVLSAFQHAKDKFYKRERSEFPSNRRISAMCVWCVRE